MSYEANAANPVFLVQLLDADGYPVTGVTSPTVYLAKSQGADNTTVQWVATTDFTWHELTSGESFKGMYKLRQVTSPNIDAVDTKGHCALHIYKTDVLTASGIVRFRVDERDTELHLLKAIVANKQSQDIDRDSADYGERTTYDDDGSTELFKQKYDLTTEAGVATRTVESV